MTPEEKQLKRDYMQTFNTDSGQRVLKDLQGRCFRHTTTDQPGEDIKINEGKRQVLLHIETMMSPEGMETPGATTLEK